MIISHKYRFIFVKTTKTAGTSIEIALSKFCGPGDVITRVNSEDEKIRQQLGYPGPQNYEAKISKFYRLLEVLGLHRRTQTTNFKNHLAAELIRDNISPEIWDSYFKFCFERNPFDKAISRYFWNTRKQEERSSLSEFLEEVPTNRLSNWHLYTIDNEIAVDFVGRYERLAEDLARVGEKLGLPEDLNLPNAKGGTRKDRSHYSTVLSAADRARIEKACAHEIAALDYGWQTEPSDGKEAINTAF